MQRATGVVVETFRAGDAEVVDLFAVAGRAWGEFPPGFDVDVAELYGEQFVPYLQAKPDSVFFANGSEIGVRMRRKIVVEPSSNQPIFRAGLLASAL